MVDYYSEKFRLLAQKLNISNDYFIRTSNPDHGQKVANILSSLHQKGFVYKAQYSGWYCERCADFVSNSEIPADKKCATHNVALKKEEQQNWFFRLSAFQTRLQEHFENNPNFIWPQTRQNEALCFLNSGLQDVSISRPNGTWGIKVPWDQSGVFYVWFDALLNYLTGPQIYQQTELIPNVQILGKDILKFHAIFWPALLLALDKPLPQKLLVHGHIQNNGQKMSKSLGNTIDPFLSCEKFGADVVRWTLLTRIPFGEDGSLHDYESFAAARDELANVFGNLQRRIWKLGAKHFPQGVTRTSAIVTPEFSKVSEAALFALSKAQEANALVEKQRPWENPAHIPELANLVLDCCLLFYPFVPQTASKVLQTSCEKTIRFEDIGILFQKG